MTLEQAHSKNTQKNTPAKTCPSHDTQNNTPDNPRRDHDTQKNTQKIVKQGLSSAGQIGGDLKWMQIT